MWRKIKQWFGVWSVDKEDKNWWRYIRADRFELGLFGKPSFNVTLSRGKNNRTLSLALGLFWWHYRMPAKRLPKDVSRYGEYPQYGFYFFEGDLWLCVGLEKKVIRSPFGIVHHSSRSLDSELNWVEGSGVIKHVDTVPFVYTLSDGTEQHRVAKLTYEEWRGRPRAFKWTSLFEVIHPRIRITFDDEVGAGAGSWKGGVLGTSCAWDGRRDPIETFEEYIAKARL